MQKKMLLIVSMLSAQVVWSAAEVTPGLSDLYLPDSSATPSTGHFVNIVRGFVHQAENNYQPEMCTNSMRRHLQTRYELGKAFSDDIFMTDRWTTLLDDVDIAIATQMHFYHTVIPLLTKNIALKLKRIDHLVERRDSYLDDGKRNTDAQIVASYNDTGCKLQQVTDEMEKLRNAVLILKDLAYRTVSSR